MLIATRVLKLRRVGGDIDIQQLPQSGAPFLDAPGSGCGVPVPASLRGLPEGDDRKFF